MFILVLFTIAKCSSTDAWIMKMYIYAIEFYSVMKKTEIMLFSVKRRDWTLFFNEGACHKHFVLSTYSLCHNHQSATVKSRELWTTCDHLGMTLFQKRVICRHRWPWLRCLLIDRWTNFLNLDMHMNLLRTLWKCQAGLSARELEQSHSCQYRPR